MSNEEREKEEQGLGELNRQLLRERGEDYPEAENLPFDAGLSDQISNPDISGEAPVGSPPTGASVRSTFDTRPVNAHDFVEFLRGSVTPRSELTGPLELSYTVPDSRIHIIRSFRYSLEPASFDPDVQLLITLNVKVNGIFQPGYTNLKPGFGGGMEIPCHILAPSNSIVTFALSFSSPGEWPSGVHYALFFVHGNSLIASGRPIEFEVGNEQKISVNKPISSPVDYGKKKPFVPGGREIRGKKQSRAFVPGRGSEGREITERDRRKKTPRWARASKRR